MAGRNSAADLSIVPLTWAHLQALGDEPLRPMLNDFAFCALAGERPIAAGGLVPAWENWGYAWFSAGSGFPRRYWPGITRAVSKSLELALSQGYCRYAAMTVHDNHPAAQRWAKRLGFEPAKPHIMDDGSPGQVYVRAS